MKNSKLSAFVLLFTFFLLSFSTVNARPVSPEALPISNQIWLLAIAAVAIGVIVAMYKSKKAQTQKNN